MLLGRVAVTLALIAAVVLGRLTPVHGAPEASVIGYGVAPLVSLVALFGALMVQHRTKARLVSFALALGFVAVTGAMMAQRVQMRHGPAGVVFAHMILGPLLVFVAAYVIDRIGIGAAA